jgi:branched-chain amino acid transport system substrate-binding protein
MPNLARRIAGVLSLAIVTALTCVAGGPAADLTPVELNVILPLTGQAALPGASEQHGLQAAEAIVNATGGINGRPLKMIYNDDGSNPQQALSLTNQLIAKNVQVMLRAALASECAPQFPIVEENGPVTYCFSPAVKSPKHGGFSFAVGPTIGQRAPFYLKYFKDRGYRKFAILTTTDATGQSFDDTTDNTVKLPELRDLKIVAHEHFNVTDISVTAQMSRIKAAQPDVVLAYATGTPFGTVLRAYNDLGMEIPMYTSGGNLILSVMRQFAPLLPKQLYFDGARGVVPDPAATGRQKQAQQAYFDALRKIGVPSDYSLLGVFDPAMIVVDALRKVGPDASAQRIRDHILGLKNWVGVQGTYDFTTGDQRGASTDAVALFRWDAPSGNFVQVAPLPGRR